MDTLLHKTLTPDQRDLLTAIAQPWIDTGEWPLWGNVQHPFDLRGQDAEAIYNSLPTVGIDGPLAAGYGLTWHRRAPLSQRDQVQLTVAGVCRLPGMRMAVGEPFMRALRHMIDLYTSRPPLGGDTPPPILRSGELEDAFPELKPWFIKVLPDLLSHEPAISTGGGAGIGDGSWEREVTRSVMQFRGMHTVEEYIEKTCEIVVKNAVGLAPAPVAAETQNPAPGRGPYVDPTLLAALEKADQASTMQLHKLIALCEGLNSAYVDENPYVCAAMIRAILDHIAPAFGHADFKQVAAQYPFGRTDKTYAQYLATYKPIGDDAMHRAIGPRVPTITMDDIPERIRLGAILNELLGIVS